MEHYAGIDVSLELSSVCVVDATGRIVREAKVASEPDALHAALVSHRAAIAQTGVNVTESSTYSLIFALGKADLRRQSSVA